MCNLVEIDKYLIGTYCLFEVMMQAVKHLRNVLSVSTRLHSVIFYKTCLRFFIVSKCILPLTLLIRRNKIARNNCFAGPEFIPQHRTQIKNL